MKKTDYEKQVHAILEEVEKILIEGGLSKGLTIVIEMGLDRAPAITYQIEDKVVRY